MNFDMLMISSAPDWLIDKLSDVNREEVRLFLCCEAFGFGIIRKCGMVNQCLRLQQGIEVLKW